MDSLILNLYSSLSCDCFESSLFSYYMLFYLTMSVFYLSIDRNGHLLHLFHQTDWLQPWPIACPMLYVSDVSHLCDLFGSLNQNHGFFKIPILMNCGFIFSQVMGDRSGNIRWWDVTTGHSSSFNTHRDGIRRIKFSPVVSGDRSRGRIAVLFYDNTFSVFDLVSLRLTILYVYSWRSLVYFTHKIGKISWQLLLSISSFWYYKH